MNANLPGQIPQKPPELTAQESTAQIIVSAPRFSFIYKGEKTPAPQQKPQQQQQQIHQTRRIPQPTQFGMLKYSETVANQKTTKITMQQRNDEIYNTNNETADLKSGF